MDLVGLIVTLLLVSPNGSSWPSESQVALARALQLQLNAPHCSQQVATYQTASAPDRTNQHHRRAFQIMAHTVVYHIKPLAKHYSGSHIGKASDVRGFWIEEASHPKMNGKPEELSAICSKDFSSLSKRASKQANIIIFLV